MTAGRLASWAAAAWLALSWHQPASAEWQADPDNRLQVRAASAIDKIRSKVEGSDAYFDDAYAVAVWPGITRFAVGFGGAYGRGIVIEQDQAVGTVSYWQGSSGIQAGGKNFALIIFFKTRESLESLKRGEIQFTGQAGIDVVTVGLAATPAYNRGVALVTVTNFGLMAEFSAAGVKFRYRPYPD